MNALIKIFAMVLVAVVPGGLFVVSAFVLARVASESFRTAAQGPHRVRRAFAALTLRDVWNQTRQSF